MNASLSSGMANVIKVNEISFRFMCNNTKKFQLNNNIC